MSSAQPVAKEDHYASWSPHLPFRPRTEPCASWCPPTNRLGRGTPWALLTRTWPTCPQRSAGDYTFGPLLARSSPSPPPAVPSPPVGGRMTVWCGGSGESAAGVAPAAARRTVREPLGSHGSHRPAVWLDPEPPVGEQAWVPASRGRQQFPRLLLPAAQPFELPARPFD
jgi:hypothetical protein